MLEIMERDIIKIDEELCTGCGDCIPGCHEGALQIIDGKVRLISDLMCDGLGACLGHCPTGALTIEKREAQAYDEIAVMKDMIPKGENVVFAHLQHLKDHDENKYLGEGISFLRYNEESIPFNIHTIIEKLEGESIPVPSAGGNCGGGCPGSAPKEFKLDSIAVDTNAGSIQSQLGHWPVQLHLVNPNAPFFKGKDVLIAADCTAFAAGNFHQEYLKGKSLTIACPKLDTGQQTYIEKIQLMIDEAQVNTLTVLIMQVPCCSGLLQIVKHAASIAKRKVPIKAIVLSVEGRKLSEDWV